MSYIPVGTTATTVAAGNDSRFTDTRTPTAGSVVAASIAAGAVTTAKIASGAVDATKLSSLGIQISTFSITAAALTQAGSGSSTPIYRFLV